jgi:osmotically-inducible protein OsmY
VVVCVLALKVEIQTETQGNKMRTDEELKADLMERLDAIPAVKSSEIEVSVDNGLVTLNGQVDTHQTRFQVERTARRVSGMRGLEIKVRPSQSGPKRSH